MNSQDDGQRLDAIIRRPRVGDGPDLAECWLDAGKFYAELDPDLFQVPEADGLAEAIERDALASAQAADAAYLVAEGGDRVVGLVDGFLDKPVDNPAKQMVRELGETRLVVNALLVHREHRRRGIGSLLMRAIEEWARSRDATLVALETWVDSSVSVPFYEAAGYGRREISFRKRLTRVAASDLGHPSK